MTPNEVGATIAYAAALDPRVGRNEPNARSLQIAAWSQQLAPVTSLADAKAAVDAHYAQPGVQALMPADVVRGVKAIRTARLEKVALEPPAEVDPDDPEAYRRWLAAATRQAADGAEVPEQRRSLTRRPVAALLAGITKRGGE
jgi:hypothetical protein